MTKFRPYSGRVFRRRKEQWVRRNLKLVIVLTVGVVALFAAETLLLTVILTPTSFTWWLLGCVQATLVGVYLHFMHAAFLANDREAIRHMRGAWGEDNTRSELQRAKRRRLIWNWVDSIALQNGDLDHLVMTRHGGLVAIDSKWRNGTADAAEMAKDGRRTKLRAEALAQSLFKSERSARHRAKVNPLPVTPVVVLWGASQHSLPDDARIDGIQFVAGRRLLPWLAELGTQPVTRSAARDIVDRLESFRRETWSSNS